VQDIGLFKGYTKNHPSGRFSVSSSLELFLALDVAVSTNKNAWWRLYISPGFPVESQFPLIRRTV